MKESTLWDNLRPVLAPRGHFQKLSDRFTGGVPDCVGSSDAVPIAMEFKEFGGVRVWKVKFRPGQKDWLRDWQQNGGGVSWIICTAGRTVYVYDWEQGDALESGIPPNEAIGRAVLVWEKLPRDRWSEFVDLLLAHSYNVHSTNKEKYARLAEGGYGTRRRNDASAVPGDPQKRRTPHRSRGS